MKMLKTLLVAAGMMATLSLGAPALAQDSSYRPGTVWESSRIKVMPGQFEAYMDYLATEWKKVQEFAKAEGMVVSYHVLATNNRRADEPHLILLVQYKDHMTTAQQVAMRAKINAMLGQDNRRGAAANGARTAMREPLGSTEYQELVLK